MGGKLALSALLLSLWAVVPWPLARWAALFLFLFIALGALWSFLVSRSLVVAADDLVLRTFSGRRIEVRTRVENRSPLPSGLLRVFDSSGGLESWGETRRWASVRPFTLSRFAFTVRGRERGERTLGPLTVSGVDPTGLFPFVRGTPPRSLIVYPALHGVRGWPQGGVPTGPRKWDPTLVDDPSRFRSYRDFRPGDPLSRLSAAAWARLGRPQVRLYDRTVGRPSAVVVDLRAARYPLRLRWALVEAAVETAATLVWELLGRGETVWLAVIDAGENRPPTLGPARGWSDARPLLERLALAVPDKAEDGPVWPLDQMLPPAPVRLLWVGPSGQSPGLPIRGHECVMFPIEEGRAHGGIVHP